jgi:hypothetical protein
MKQFIIECFPFVKEQCAITSVRKTKVQQHNAFVKQYHGWCIQQSSYLWSGTHFVCVQLGPLLNSSWVCILFIVGLENVEHHYKRYETLFLYFELLLSVIVG